MGDGCFVCLTGPFHAQHEDEGNWAAYEPGLNAQLTEIKNLQEPEHSLAVVLSKGAGLAVLENGPQVSTFAEDGCVAAFTGILRNMSTIHKILQRLDASKSCFSNPMDGASPVRETREPHAICKLYRSLGPAMVARLHGDFAFVLHDSRMGQTLAACSAGTAGTAPYLQYALTGDNHLVVTGGFQGMQSHGKLSRPQLRLPVSWGPLQEVRSYHYIYGQDGRVQQFAFIPEGVIDGEEVPSTSHVEGMLTQVTMARTSSSPAPESGSLMDSAALDGSGLVKRTRRGKRAGRNIKERASFESHRASMDSRRGSIDERASLDLPTTSRFLTDSQRPPSLDGHQGGDNSRADSDRWWRRSTDTSAPTSPARDRMGHTGLAGAGHYVSARRACSMPDPMAMKPPRDLTIPEHPEDSSSAAPGDCNLQARAAPMSRGQDSTRVYRSHAGRTSGSAPSGAAPAGPLFRGAHGPPTGSAGQPMRGFGSGASIPRRAPAGAAAAAAAALNVAPGRRPSLERLGRQGADLAQARSLERQAGGSSDCLQAARTEKTGDAQEVPAMMRSGSGPLSGQTRDDNLHGLSATAAQAAKPIGPL